MPNPQAAPAPSSYTTDRRRLPHRHCGACGVAVPGRRLVDIPGPDRPPHRCAVSDLVECPNCREPILRRVADWAPLNPDLSRHDCPGDDDEAGYQADLAEGIMTGRWPWYERQRREREAAEERERDEEADQYAAWLAYRAARGIPDHGEGGAL